MARSTHSQELPSADEAVKALKKELSGYDEDFSFGILMQLGSLSLTKDPHGAGFLFARSVLKKVRSGDHMEMLLVTQMLAVHDATMTLCNTSWRLRKVCRNRRFSRNTFNKFARTFSHQMDTLQRWRSGTEQKVTVQNVSVSDGGQAIVGNVTQNTGGSGTKTSRNPRLL